MNIGPAFWAPSAEVLDGSLLWNSANEVGVWTFTNGDRTAQYVSGPGGNSIVGTTGRASGKRYFEIVWDTVSAYGSSVYNDVGISLSNPPVTSVCEGACYRQFGTVFKNTTPIGSGAAVAAGNVIGVAADLNTGSVWFSINNAWISGDPAAGTSPSVSGLAGGTYYVGASVESGAVMKVSLRTWRDDFTYPAPSGFISWAAA